MKQWFNKAMDLLRAELGILFSRAHNLIATATGRIDLLIIFLVVPPPGREEEVYIPLAHLQVNF